LQKNPQLVPSHVSVAWAGGAGHAMHELVPQLARLVSLTHTPAQL
jgi:hypothetical protein